MTTVPLDVKLMNLTTRLLVLGFVLSALGAGASWAANHPVFAIRGVTVLGELNHTNALALQSYVGPQLKGTVMTVDLEALRRAFETVPWVRRAVVQREFPNRLKVHLEEHLAVAYWGEDGDTALVNSHGEVFEANLGEDDSEDMPRLSGPVDQSAQVLALYGALAPWFDALDLPIELLEMSARGNWRVKLASGANIELGSGTTPQVMTRVRQFLSTVGQVAAHHGRQVGALESADLRYAQGYALRLQGVSTVKEQPASQGRGPNGKKH